MHHKDSTAQDDQRLKNYTNKSIMLKGLYIPNMRDNLLEFLENQNYLSQISIVLKKTLSTIA